MLSLLAAALALNRWAWQASADELASRRGTAVLPALAAALPPSEAGCWALDACARGLELLVAVVGGSDEGWWRAGAACSACLPLLHAWP